MLCQLECHVCARATVLLKGKCLWTLIVSTSTTHTGTWVSHSRTVTAGMLSCVLVCPPCPLVSMHLAPTKHGSGSRITPGASCTPTPCSESLPEHSSTTAALRCVLPPSAAAAYLVL